MPYILCINHRIPPNALNGLLWVHWYIFLSPIDSIPDLLGPLGFTDDIAVLALVYTQMKAYLTDEIKMRAQAAVDELLKK